MMNNCLFVYRRVTRNEQTQEETVHDNFLNPLAVTSFYWDWNDKGAKILNIFLTNGKTIVFYEAIGKRFVDHMETFLRYMIGVVGATPRQTRRDRTERTNGPRTAIEAEFVEDIQELQANFES